MGLKWNKLFLSVLFLISGVFAYGQLDESVLKDLQNNHNFEEARPPEKLKEKEHANAPITASAHQPKTTPSNQGNGMQILGICLLVIIVGFMIYYFIHQKNGSATDKKIDVERKLVEDLEEIEDISTLETIDLLKASEENQSYNIAIRILFLRLLQLLNEQRLITWKKRKTNREYLNEIMTHHAYLHIFQLTQVYEKAWYGDSTISEGEYTSVKNSFESLIQSLTNEK